MPKRKGMAPNKYMDRIYRTMHHYRFMSTSEIAERLDMGYETTLKYLYKLWKRGKIRCRRIGKNRIWFL